MALTNETIAPPTTYGPSDYEIRWEPEALDGMVDIDLHTDNDDPNLTTITGRLSLTPTEAIAFRSALDAALGDTIISRGQIEEWAGTTDADTVDRIIAAIPNSSIPEAIGAIADGLTRPDEHPGDGNFWIAAT